MKTLPAPGPLPAPTVEHLAHNGVFARQSGPGTWEYIVPDTMTQADVDALVAAFDPLPALRAAKITQLQAHARESIVGGFQSSAVGSPHWYDGDIEDQINIMGAAQAGTALPFRCTPVDSNGNPTGPRAFVPHTAAQLKQVYQDGVAFKLGQLQKLENLKAAVEAATTEADIEAVVW